MMLATSGPVERPGHALAPWLLPEALQLTAEPFEAVCQANGAQQGWLLIPEQQAVEVWPASGGGDPQRNKAATSLDAGSLFTGLQIDLLEIWQV